MQGQRSQSENSDTQAEIALFCPANNLPYKVVAELLKYYK